MQQPPLQAPVQLAPVGVGMMMVLQVVQLAWEVRVVQVLPPAQVAIGCAGEWGMQSPVWGATLGHAPCAHCAGRRSDARIPWPGPRAGRHGWA